MAGSASVWPLDAELLLDMEEDPGDNRVATAMRAGPPKFRRLGTVPRATLSGAIQIRQEDLDVLLAWGHNVLRNWTLPFSWRHPRTGRYVDLIVAPGAVPRARRASIEEEGRSLYLVPLALEVVP